MSVERQRTWDPEDEMALAIGLEKPFTAPGRDVLTLPGAFEHALSRSFVAFQPIVSWRERAVYGFEALVRSRGRVLRGASELVSAAESLGTLPALGRSVRAAVARAVPAAPEGALLFVNVHPDDLLDPELSSAGAPLSRVAGRVVLELTERAASIRGGEIRERIAALRHLGYRIAIDDLGTGYSALALLAELQPEFVKLDMSLVRRLDRDEKRRRIVGHVLSLLRDLGARAIAEGVETPAERDALEVLGAPLQQGFLFGTPGPGLVAPSW